MKDSKVGTFLLWCFGVMFLGFAFSQALLPAEFRGGVYKHFIELKSDIGESQIMLVKEAKKYDNATNKVVTYMRAHKMFLDGKLTSDEFDCVCYMSVGAKELNYRCSERWEEISLKIKVEYEVVE